jgi:hypothetical protein
MSGKRTLHDYFSSGKKQKISDDESPVQDELQQPSTSRTSTIPVECPVITEVKLKSDSDFDSGDDSIANDFSSETDLDDDDDEKSESIEFTEWLRRGNEYSATSNAEKDVNTKKSPGPADLSQSPEDEPKQPELILFPRTKFGNKQRQFSSAWYKLYPTWLEYSVLCDAAFCFVCRHFSVNPPEVFVSTGFKNWKRALERDSGFKKHEVSMEHKNCHLKWINYSKIRANAETSVMSQVNEAHRALVEENKAYMTIVIDILIYTATQNIAQRGNRENLESSNRGNFLELLDLFAKHNLVVKKKIVEEVSRNAKYTSAQVQNEILFICSKMILDKISDEIRRASCFALMCDETKDISKTEQISVVIRYYLDGTIYERFIGFRAAKNLDAKSLLSYIKELLNQCGVDMQKCIAQNYDGASVMSGRVKGVQKLFRDEVPRAIYVHCYNHRLNLITVDICKNLSHGKLFFDFLETLFVFMSGSAVHSQFIETQRQINPEKKPVELKRICYTRWTAQVHACSAIKTLVTEILVFLNKLIADKSDRSAEAIGMLHQIDFNFIFNLCMYY